LHERFTLGFAGHLWQLNLSPIAALKGAFRAVCDPPIASGLSPCGVRYSHYVIERVYHVCVYVTHCPVTSLKTRIASRSSL